MKYGDGNRMLNLLNSFAFQEAEKLIKKGETVTIENPAYAAYVVLKHNKRQKRRKQARIAIVSEMLSQNANLKSRDIMKKLRVSQTTADRYLKEARNDKENQHG